MSPALRATGRRRYVSLTTFRRSGVRVATPVWIAPAGDALVVTTQASTGKVKRLRHDPRVELAECDMRGRVRRGAPVVRGTAELVHDAALQAPLLDAIRRKYGWQYRAVTLVERVLAGEDRGDRVVLRIRDA